MQSHGQSRPQETTGTLCTGYAGGGAGPLETAPDLEHSVTLARILTHMGLGVLLFFGLVAASV